MVLWLVKQLASVMGRAAAVLLLLGGSTLITLLIVQTDNELENRLFVTQAQAAFAHRQAADTRKHLHQAIESIRLLHPEALPTLLLRDERGYARGGAVSVVPGLVVTSAHCVADSDVVRLEWQGHLWVGVVVFRSTLEQDVAVIAVPDGHDLPIVTMRRGREGQRVWALGYPYGFPSGNVVTGYLGPRLNATQTLASLPSYAGYSGCAVYDAGGRLVGLCNAVARRGVGPLAPYGHLCLITPTSVIQDVLGDWRNFGRAGQ